MLLDGDHLLLGDKPMPAAQRLGVIGGVGIIGRHVLAHNRGRISGDIKTRPEAVLQAHPGHGLRVDAVPCAVSAFDELLHLSNMALIFVGLPWLGNLALIGHRARLVWPSKPVALLISLSNPACTGIDKSRQPAGKRSATFWHSGEHFRGPIPYWRIEVAM